ncbi:unnamed protein product [Amoebophrya sp. A25]|nr:unnamed protein product [Amoebophrya sp. A25]|eukprot:GSA25T00025379001.1
MPAGHIALPAEGSGADKYLEELTTKYRLGSKIKESAATAKASKWITPPRNMRSSGVSRASAVRNEELDGLLASIGEVEKNRVSGDGKGNEAWKDSAQKLAAGMARYFDKYPEDAEAVARNLPKQHASDGSVVELSPVIVGTKKPEHGTSSIEGSSAQKQVLGGSSTRELLQEHATRIGKMMKQQQRQGSVGLADIRRQEVNIPRLQADPSARISSSHKEAVHPLFPQDNNNYVARATASRGINDKVDLEVQQPAAEAVSTKMPVMPDTNAQMPVARLRAAAASQSRLQGLVPGADTTRKAAHDDDRWQ